MPVQVVPPPAPPMLPPPPKNPKAEVDAVKARLASLKALRTGKKDDHNAAEEAHTQAFKSYAKSGDEAKADFHYKSAAHHAQKNKPLKKYATGR